MTTARLYATAFVFVLLAGAALGLAALGSLRSIGLLWASIGCSLVAGVAAITALVRRSSGR